MNIYVRQFEKKDISQAMQIWNDIVKDGNAFPQTEEFDEKTGLDFFGSQTYTAVAVDTESDTVAGLYILHPNNVGRCGHICNASYVVAKAFRGRHIGEALVRDCLKQAVLFGFKILQFNAVVSSNKAALSLYKKLGFTQLGTIPDGFLCKDGTYCDIIPHYILLKPEFCD